MTVNISKKLDLNLLDEVINSFMRDECVRPIILMAPETLADMPTLNMFNDCLRQSTRNNCTGLVGMYHGNKVFSDPTKDYGDVELR